MARVVRSVVVAVLVVGCGPPGRDHADAPPGPADARQVDARPIADARPDAMPPDAPPDAGPTDCAHLPATPRPVTVLSGFVPSEDLAFDGDGHVIESDTINIYKTTKALARTTFVPGLDFRAGMRMTPTGKLMVNQDTTGNLIRIDPDGTRHTILSGLNYPNGMEVGNDGHIYITAQGSNLVLRVDPESGEATTMTSLVNQPNGLTFSPDYHTLYIGAFSGEGTIYAVDIDAGVPSNFRAWKTGVGTGLLDGMGVDACGNVYVADYGQSKILRIASDASGEPIVIVDRSAEFSYMPNYQWGSGIGGWDSHRLYIVGVGEGIFEVDLGVDSKPREAPP